MLGARTSNTGALASLVRWGFSLDKALIVPLARRLPPLLEPLKCAWRDRSLIWRLSVREIQARYRGSLLGVAWLVLLPLFMLAVYTFAFSIVFRMRWAGASESTAAFALLLFLGLSTFTFFSDTVNRAPTQILENAAYVKKVVFPLEVLPWVAVLVNGFTFLVSFLIFACFYPFVFGLPPLTILWLPVVLAPLLFLTLGLAWALASMGVFLRDIRPSVTVLTTALMFLSPIFYPLEAVPEQIRRIIALNPMAAILENLRAVVFWGQQPALEWLVLQYALGFAIMWLGYAWFSLTRKAFADVL